MSVKRIIGVIISVISVVVGILAINTISSDKQPSFQGYYSYTAPFTSHEIGVISSLVAAIVFLIVGICLIISRDKNK